MEMNMKKLKLLCRVLIVIGLLAGVGLVASPTMAASEQTPTIKIMRLSVWPEYDDPRVLVIYQGEFNDAASFPQKVQFPAPMGSEINQVCALKQPGDEHLCQLYDTLTGEDNMLGISYTLPIPTYFLEYYWDGIKGSPDKSFSFKYVAPYAIDTLMIDVQQPKKATDFKLAQTYSSATTDSQGLRYYNYTFNKVEPGQVITIDATYNKPDNKPSVDKKQGAGGGAGSVNTTALLGIGAAAIAVFVIGFVAFKRKPARVPVRTAQARRAEAMRRAEARRPVAPEPSRQQRPAAPPVTQAKQGAAPQQAPAGGSFCSKCGSRLESGDMFCNACGAKARRSS